MKIKIELKNPNNYKQKLTIFDGSEYLKGTLLLEFIKETEGEIESHVSMYVNKKELINALKHFAKVYKPE